MEDKDDGVVALAMEDNDEKPEFKNSNGVKDVPPPLEVGRPAAPASDFVPPADLRDVRRFGTTFSLVELRRRNIEWRAALRVSACWADIEIDEGAFDFEELDEVLGLCGELGYEVLLTVGVKAPRPVQHDAWGWTDYHIPDWAEPDDAPADLASDERLCARALAYVRELVARYARLYARGGGVDGGGGEVPEPPAGYTIARFTCEVRGGESECFVRHPRTLAAAPGGSVREIAKMDAG